MNIEEIKADLEDIERIRAEHKEAFAKIKIEDFTGCLPANKFAEAQLAEIYRARAAIDCFSAKYAKVIKSSGIGFKPPYDSSDIDDFLKFFLALYEETQKPFKFY